MHPGHRGGGHHLGAGQVALRLARSHPPLEVPVGGGDPHLAGGEEPHPEPDARPAPRRERPGSRVHDRLPHPAPLRLLLHPLARRGHVELDPLGHALAVQDLRRGLEVLEPGVHAGDEVRLVDRHLPARHLRQRGHDLDGVGAGDVGGELGEVQADAPGVGSVGVRRGGRLRPGTEVVFPEPLDAFLRRPVENRFHIGDGPLVHREPAHQGPPLGGHVGDGEAGVHGERGRPGAGELHRRVQHLAPVVEPAQRHDHVLPGHPGSEGAAQHHLHGGGDLPPEDAGGPDGGGVGTHHRSAHRAQAPVHVGVRIRGHHERPRNRVALLHHDLVADAASRWMELDPVLAGEGLYGPVLVEVRLGAVLDVVVQREDDLPGLVDARDAETLELRHHRRAVVVGHDVARPYGDEIPGPDGPRRRAVGQVALGDFLDHGLTHGEPPIP